MKKIAELLPWKVTDISLRPYKGMWSFNPSVHFDGQTWRCALRCSDYAMPGGVTVRSARAKAGQSQTKNALVVLDPKTWRPVEIYKMRERDEFPRAAAGSLGYEDIRLFWTAAHGLQGIAAALHLRRDDRKKPIAEQVLLWFDAAHNIIDAEPIRGRGWSDVPQKNWVPFDRSTKPCFLYAIDRGTLFDARGALPANARVAAREPAAALGSTVPRSVRAFERAQAVDVAPVHERASSARGSGRSLVEDVDASGYAGLRGGTQLVPIAEDQWLALGHAMCFVDGRKYYWHVWYSVDAAGRLIAASCPMKLVDAGIEFAAGLAIDGDRVVVSFGVDDMACGIGETSLAAVRATLRPVQAATPR